MVGNLVFIKEKISCLANFCAYMIHESGLRYVGPFSMVILLYKKLQNIISSSSLRHSLIFEPLHLVTPCGTVYTLLSKCLSVLNLQAFVTFQVFLIKPSENNREWNTD